MTSKSAAVKIQMITFVICPWTDSLLACKFVISMPVNDYIVLPPTVRLTNGQFIDSGRIERPKKD